MEIGNNYCCTIIVITIVIAIIVSSLLFFFLSIFPLYSPLVFLLLPVIITQLSPLSLGIPVNICYLLNYGNELVIPILVAIAQPFT